MQDLVELVCSMKVAADQSFPDLEEKRVPDLASRGVARSRDEALA